MKNIHTEAHSAGNLRAADFGKAIRRERKALGHTQQWLANNSGVTRETIVQLEAGKNVGLHIVIRVLGSLDKSLSVASGMPDEPPAMWRPSHGPVSDDAGL